MRRWESWHNQNVRNLLARAGLQIVGPRLWQFQSNFLINIDFHLIIISGIKFKQLFPPPPGLTGNQPSPLQALVVLDFKLTIDNRTAADVQLGRRGEAVS